MVHILTVYTREFHHFKVSYCHLALLAPLLPAAIQHVHITQTKLCKSVQCVHSQQSFQSFWAPLWHLSHNARQRLWSRGRDIYNVYFCRVYILCISLSLVVSLNTYTNLCLLTVCCIWFHQWFVPMIVSSVFVLYA